MIKQQANLFTHRDNYKMTILQTTISSVFSRMKMFELPLKFGWILILAVQLTIRPHWYRWWLGPNRRQAIIWANYDIVHCHINTSLGLNELLISPPPPTYQMLEIHNYVAVLRVEVVKYHDIAHDMSHSQVMKCLKELRWLFSSCNTSK